jgi:YggT family protein
MGSVTNILISVLNLILYLILFAFMLRMLFQLFRADARNPVAVNIAQLTNIVVEPLRSYVPRTRYIDLSTFLCWFTISAIRLGMLFYLSPPNAFSPVLFLAYVLTDFILQFTTIVFYATLFYTILNFVAPGLQSVGIDTLRSLSEPVLKIVRSKIPPTSGFDFAPLVVLMVAKFTQIALTSYLEASYFY